MNTTLTASPADLRDAMYALSLRKEVPDAGVLDDVVRRYPQFSEELTSFAIAIAIDVIRGHAATRLIDESADTTTTSSAVMGALSRFQNRLHQVESAPVMAAAVPTAKAGLSNPFVDLSRDEFRGFVARLGSNTVFGAKLRDRQIDPDSMTHGFKKRVADELRAPLDVVVAHFAAEQIIAGRAQFFKADVKPTSGGRQSFAEAVKNSGLSEEQQRNLLAL